MRSNKVIAEIKIYTHRIEKQLRLRPAKNGSVAAAQRVVTETGRSKNPPRGRFENDFQVRDCQRRWHFYLENGGPASMTTGSP